MDASQLSNAVNSGKYPGITLAKCWQRGPHNRIYLTTDKWNGGKSWNDGLGYRSCYIDLISNKLIAHGVAGAATRKGLADTFQALADDYNLKLNIST